VLSTIYFSYLGFVATQFFIHIFDKFLEKIKNSKKTTKTHKKCILIYLHHF